MTIDNPNIKQIEMRFAWFGDLDVVGKQVDMDVSFPISKRIVIPSGKETRYDNGLHGFLGFYFVEELVTPDQNGNRFVKYKLFFPTKIEGLEGWRDWKFLGNGQLNVGPWGLLKAFGTLKGTFLGASPNKMDPVERHEVYFLSNSILNYYYKK